MSDTIPPWGCPWHGLIKNGQVELPNQSTVAMRQPPNGDTHLIDLSAPLAGTGAEDIALGKQWLNKAIISSDQIHGTEVGAGKWIYQAPDGSNWLVSTTIPASSDSTTEVNVKLTKFGVFGGQKIEHEYTVPMPDVSAEAAFWGVAGNTGFNMHSAHPQGHAAIFAMTTYFDYPLAWLELKLSDPADDQEITLSVIRTAEQTAGVKVVTGSIPSVESWLDKLTYTTQTDRNWVKPSYPDCSGTYTDDVYPTLSDGSGYGSFDLKFNRYDISYSVTYSALILSLNYNDLGVIVETTANVTMQALAVSGEPSVTVGKGSETYNVVPNEAQQQCDLELVSSAPWAISASQSVTINHSVSVTVMAQGSTPATTVKALDCSASFSVSSEGWKGGPTLTDVQLGRDYSYSVDGLNQSYSKPYSGFVGELYLDGVIYSVDGFFPWFTNRKDGEVQHPFIAGGAGMVAFDDNSVYTAQTGIELVKYSNNVNGITVQLRDVSEPFPRTGYVPDGVVYPDVNISSDSGDSVATPDGFKPVDPHVDFFGQLHASYNPITKVAVRTPDGPINWT